QTAARGRSGGGAHLRTAARRTPAYGRAGPRRSALALRARARRAFDSQQPRGLALRLGRVRARDGAVVLRPRGAGRRSSRRPDRGVARSDVAAAGHLRNVRAHVLAVRVRKRTLCGSLRPSSGPPGPPSVPRGGGGIARAARGSSVRTLPVCSGSGDRPLSLAGSRPSRGPARPGRRPARGSFGPRRPPALGPLRTRGRTANGERNVGGG